ncbi:lytic transglycosylase, catalytic [Cellvibrio sp. BR]|uniref:transglycosylase SLT domain-containing protein n=1 Tax=unclassified Cellvibrio TaxID=2624793 RepID=UPI00026012A5|nr:MULTISPECIES: transglycosylase SLT domain-containing protein [unclassified Cellvibrio]EIK45747.1 lytic transglycosylase, catalytic [Cellvibrio sp. BR]UUA73927.1 transglycosylase SLT domain-containing protein [Cellvibrio sp. QJXJ]
MSIVSLNNSANTSASSNAIAASPSALEAAAEQFEALFLQQVLKQMRKAGDVLAADNPMRSRELDTMRDFYDGMLADTLASKRQTGIADLLVQQLSGKANQLDTLDEASETARAAALPERSSASMDSLRSTWQRSVDSLANVWNKGSTGFKALVDSVIKQESAGQVDAVSPKGALGIMQLMPDTARQMAQELGVNFNLGRLTRDADYNKQLGSAFLSKLLERYDGEQALAVAAYNAGPARVDEWLERHGDPRIGDISVSAWVRQIPFKETREYTSKILADLGQSASLKQDQAAASVLPLIPGQERFKSAPIPVALTQRTDK